MSPACWVPAAKSKKRDMTHDHDLKDLGAFQMLTPEECVAALCWIIGMGAILEPWLR